MVLRSSECGFRQKENNVRVPQKGNRGTLNVAFMNSIRKRFLRTLVGGQGLRDDPMDYI